MRAKTSVALSLVCLLGCSELPVPAARPKPAGQQEGPAAGKPVAGKAERPAAKPSGAPLGAQGGTEAAKATPRLALVPLLPPALRGSTDLFGHLGLEGAGTTTSALGGTGTGSFGVGTIRGLDGVGLVGPDAGSLLGVDGGTLVGLDAGTLIGVDAGTLIGVDAGSLTAGSSGRYALQQAFGGGMPSPCELTAMLSDDLTSPPLMREVSPLGVLAEPLRLMLIAYGVAGPEGRVLNFEKFKMFDMALSGRLRVKREGDDGSIHVWLRDGAGKLGHIGSILFTGANRGTLMVQAVVPFLGLLSLRGNFDLDRGETLIDIATFPGRPGFELISAPGVASQLHVRQRIELRRVASPDGSTFTYSSALARSFVRQGMACGEVRRVTTGKFLPDNSSYVYSRVMPETPGEAPKVTTWHLDPAGVPLAAEAVPAALRALAIRPDELLEAPESAKDLTPGEQQLFFMPPPPEGP
jgi:hypothetical protein